MLLAVALGAAAATVAAGRGPSAAGRLARLAAPAGDRPPAQLGPRAACALAGVAVALLVGGAFGAVAGALVALAGPAAVGRLEPAAHREERQRLRRDAPLTLDLLAACLAGGAATTDAAAAVSRAVGGPCGRRLAGVGAALAVGTAPGQAWAALSAGLPDDPLAGAARALARAADGGAPVAGTVARLAEQARADARADDEQAARRVGVLVVAPLGLCFLPAFVLLGVAPVVAGLAGPVLAGL